MRMRTSEAEVPRHVGVQQSAFPSPRMTRKGSSRRLGGGTAERPSCEAVGLPIGPCAHEGCFGSAAVVRLPPPFFGRATLHRATNDEYKRRARQE